MEDRGFALAEVLVVITIIGILTAVAAIDYRNWVVGASIERQIKEIHSDLMQARLQAMHKNRMHFVSLDPRNYRITDDRNDNGTREEHDAVVVDRKGLTHKLTWSGVADTEMAFGKKGLSRDNKTVCIFSDANPSYDCLILSASRINLGKIKNASSRCLSTNCMAK